LRLLRQSGRQYALCGYQRADHWRRPVISAPHEWPIRPACLRRSNPRASRYRRERPLPVFTEQITSAMFTAHPHAEGDPRQAQAGASPQALAAPQAL
jgi:hypothetical protein